MTAPGPPPKPPGCICGTWTYVNGHWTFILDPRCPVHGDA